MRRLLMIFCLLRQSSALRTCLTRCYTRQSPSLSRTRKGRLRIQRPLHFHLMNYDSRNSSVPPDRWTPTGAPGTLERLCSVSLRACELMNPLISSIYQQLASSNLDSDGSLVKKLKQDNSAFTIADGLVQRLLIDTLYSRISFRDIVGEEEDDEKRMDNGDDKMSLITEDESWFKVQGLTIPQELRPVLESTKAAIDALAETHFPPSSKNDTICHRQCLEYQHLTVFIDPIDGTREFSTGMGEQCSVCIGFADERGKAVAGVIYRPLSQPKPTWVAGAKSERFAVCDFGGDKVIHSLDGRRTSLLETNSNENSKRGSLLTTNGYISPFLESLIEELQMERVKSGGAGNKLMMLLEQSLFGKHTNGKSFLYVQDRGVSRWDTCAAAGVLEAFGGKVTKLTTHLPETSNLERKSYSYLASRLNLDFISGLATITKYNCSPSAKDVKENQKALDVTDVKAYSNLCGLVALGEEWNTPERIMHIEKAVQRAAKIHPPSFD